MHGLSCPEACGIFPDQGSNPRLLHWQVDSKPLDNQGSPRPFIFKAEQPETSGLCIVAQSCPTPWDPMDCSPPGSSVHGDSSGKNAKVGCHALLQGIFSTQGSNPGLLHCRRILYHLSQQGSPIFGATQHHFRMLSGYPS